MFLVDYGSGQLGRGGYLVLLNDFLACYKKGFTLLVFCESSMAMQQGSDDPAWRVFARVVCVLLFYLLVFGIKVFYMP